MINWFPQHMMHAAKEIGKLLARVDVVIEVRDARVPLSSSSPHLAALLPSHMPVVVVLNKVDLANPNLSQRALHKVGGPERALLASCGGSFRGRGVEAIFKLCSGCVRTRPRPNDPLHVLVVGGEV